MAKEGGKVTKEGGRKVAKEGGGEVAKGEEEK